MPPTLFSFRITKRESLGQRSLGILYLGRVQFSLVKLLQLYPGPQTPAFFFC